MEKRWHINSAIFSIRILKGIQNALSSPSAGARHAQGEQSQAARMERLFYELGSCKKDAQTYVSSMLRMLSPDYDAFLASNIL